MTTITINNQEYPLNFGWNALRRFCDQTKVNVLMIEQAMVTRMDLAILAIYIGVSEGYRKKSETFKITIDQFTDLFDKDPNAIKSAIAEMEKQLTMVVDKMEGKESKNVNPPTK